MTPGQGSSALPHNYQYAYDGVGNRTSISADGVASTLGYNAANEWVTDAAGGKTANCTWDAAGNELGNDGFGDPAKALHLTYTPENQTASITDTQGNTIPMTYAGAGPAQRVTAGWVASNPDTPGGPATYTYGGTGLTVQSDNTGTDYYTRDPSGTLISQRTPSGTNYYLFDGEGDVVKLVNASGAVVATYFDRPTGNAAEPPSGPAAAGNPYRKWSAFFEPGAKDYKLPNGLRVDSNSLNATQLSINSLQIGNIAHALIEISFVATHLATYQMEQTIVNRATGDVIHIDLLNRSAGLFYEIKPWTQLRAGIRQIQRYIAFGQAAGIALAPDPSPFPPTAVSAGGILVVAWQGPYPGLVLYAWAWVLPLAPTPAPAEPEPPLSPALAPALV